MALRRLRTLIVDDEPLARERILDLIRDDADLKVAAPCRNGRQAIESICSHPPDLLFLDVQMPEVDGFDVLRAVGPDRVAAVVFVTAFDRYALKAFDFFAVDYLLKPFSRERFQQALSRAKNQALQRRRGPGPLQGLLESLERDRSDRLVIRESGRIHFLWASEIDWIKAAGNYAEVHVGTRTFLARRTMKELEGALDPSRFLRIQRSAIVALDFIRQVRPLAHGEYEVVLRDGSLLKSSRALRDKLKALFGET